MHGVLQLGPPTMTQNAVFFYIGTDSSQEAKDAEESVISSLDTSSVRLNKHNLSLTAMQVDVHHVVGARRRLDHDILISDTFVDDDDFIESDTFLKERRAIAHLTAQSRTMVKEAVTWLSSHWDWLRASQLMNYFYNTYPILKQAMNEVNKLGPVHLDTHHSSLWADGRMNSIEDIPIYCSWSYRPKVQGCNVFYVPTRVPTGEQIHRYLNVMLGVSPDLVEAIVHATYGNPEEDEQAVADEVAEETQESSLFNAVVPGTTNMFERILNERMKHFKQDHKSPKVKHRFLDSDLSDPREARASRLNKRQDIRETFAKHNPRLVLATETKAIRRLQARPDYLFKPHYRYVNVFILSLPEGAPKVYPPNQDRWE
jgi:hypothetical protein